MTDTIMDTQSDAILAIVRDLKDDNERLRKVLEKVLEFESRYHEWLNGEGPFPHEDADRLHDIMLRQARQALEQK